MLKKIIATLVLFFLLFLSAATHSAFGQPRANIGEDFELKVYYDHAELGDDITSLRSIIEWDSTLIRYRGIRFMTTLSGATILLNERDSLSGKITIAAAAVQPFPDDSLLYVLDFTAGDSAVDMFVTSSLQFNEFPDIDDTTRVIIGSPVGIDDELPLLSYEFDVYPNPANDFFNVRVDMMGEVENAYIAMYDAIGRRIKVVQEGATHDSIFYSRIDLPSGVYYVKLTTDRISVTRPLTIVR